MPMGKGLHPIYREEPSKTGSSTFRKAAKNVQDLVVNPPAVANKRGPLLSADDGSGKVLMQSAGREILRGDQTRMRETAKRAKLGNNLTQAADLLDDKAVGRKTF